MHCFSQLNGAIQTVRNHIDETGKLDNPKSFLDDLKTAQAFSSDLYVHADLYRTAFMQRLMELKTKEVVYMEPSDLEAYGKVQRNKDNSFIAVH